MGDLQEKNELLNNIIKNFPDVNPSNFNESSGEIVAICASTLVFGFLMYCFVSGKTKAWIS